MRISSLTSRSRPSNLSRGEVLNHVSYEKRPTQEKKGGILDRLRINDRLRWVWQKILGRDSPPPVRDRRGPQDTRDDSPNARPAPYREENERALERMMMPNDPGRPDEHKIDGMAHQLGRFEPGVVQLMERQGVEIITPETPEEMAHSMARTGTLETTSLQEAARDTTAAAQFDPGSVRQNESSEKRRRALDHALHRRDISFVSAGAIDVRTTKKKDLKQHQNPVSLEELAPRHGFQDEDSRQQFFSLVEAGNGERLDEAQRLALNEQEQRVESAETPQERILAQKQLDAWKADPHTIPVDVTQHDLLVPDVVRYENLEMDSKNWSKFVRNNDAGGIFFNRKNVVQVDHKRAQSWTFTHEVGHAIDDSVKDADPEFYGEWRPRVQEAYEAAGTEGREPISPYSRSNTTEYIAESVKWYMKDPERMKEVDPEMYALTEELLDYAADLGENPDLQTGP